MHHPASRIFAAVLLTLVALCLPGTARAARCAIGPREAGDRRISPAPPLRRGVLGRESLQAPEPGVHATLTPNFRILWGEEHPRGDPDWAPGPDGVPRWVRELGEALESARLVQGGFGFPEPYGADRYLLDVYVADTGATAHGSPVRLGPGFYGYADVDPGAGAAYFVFGADFSGTAGDEVAVLRAVAAHELFHAVQRAEYPWDDRLEVPASRWAREGWWFEATATWMEEVCEPDADDYVPFVRGFLARPEQPLGLRDGRREYGAAILPGFLWARHGPGLWREVLRDAHSLGVEAALADALRARGTELPATLAEFWAAAAHPEDLWEDGAAYRGAESPRVLQPGAPPVSVAASPATAPGRFGATLVSVPAGPWDVRVAVESAPGAEFRVATSRSGTPGEVTARTGSVPPQILYLAVVNVSEHEDPAPFEVVLEREGAPPPPDAGADGGGGCFLGLLSGEGPGLPAEP